MDVFTIVYFAMIDRIWDHPITEPAIVTVRELLLLRCLSANAICDKTIRQQQFRMQILLEMQNAHDGFIFHITRSYVSISHVSKLDVR